MLFVLLPLGFLVAFASCDHQQLKWKNRQSEATTSSGLSGADGTDVVMAEYNLDMGRWVCPTSNAKPAAAAITLSEDNQTSNMTTEIHSVNAFLNENEMKKASMFSLSEARILDNDANESNFMTVFNQLTRLNLEGREMPIFDRDQENLATLSGNEVPSNPRMMTMGVDTRFVRPTSQLGKALLPRRGRPGRGDEEEIVPYAQPALCKPELTLVNLNESTDPNIFIFPNCIRIERCGGCCNHDLLECQPRDIEMQKMRLIQTTFQGANYEHVGEVVVSVEKHKTCQCGCKIKEHHCNDRQYYVSNLCRCECTDKNQEAECKRRPYDRFWDPDRCECRCKNKIDCSTGMRFDPNTCRCTGQ